MIKKEYLSEVEALYAQGQALHTQPNIPRLFPVVAHVGRDVHGFVAVRESVSNDIVTFKPVSDIVALHYEIVQMPSMISNGKPVEGHWHEYTFDPSLKTPDTLVRLLLDRSKWKDQDAICGEVPTLDEEA